MTASVEAVRVTTVADDSVSRGQTLIAGLCLIGGLAILGMAAKNGVLSDAFAQRVVDLLGTLAWPTVALVGIRLFRPELGAAIHRVKEVLGVKLDSTQPVSRQTADLLDAEPLEFAREDDPTQPGVDGSPSSLLTTVVPTGVTLSSATGAAAVEISSDQSSYFAKEPEALVHRTLNRTVRKYWQDYVHLQFQDRRTAEEGLILALSMRDVLSAFDRDALVIWGSQARLLLNLREGTFMTADIVDAFFAAQQKVTEIPATSVEAWLQWLIQSQFIDRTSKGGIEMADRGVDFMNWTRRNARRVEENAF